MRQLDDRRIEAKITPNNARRVTTSELITSLTRSFKTYAKQNIIERHPSVFIKGQPGIGKSQAVRTISDNLKNSTDKTVHIIDIRLLMFNPVDLRGIPVADVSTKTSIWLRPEVFDLEDSENIINILFLDELTSAPQSIQAVAYQIALDRRLGEHRIPDNTFIIAAGNREDDYSVTFDMPSALKNRFIHFEIRIDLAQWLLWAEEKGIHESITSFLKVVPHRFVNEHFDGQEQVIVTPRSWETLSNLLNALPGTPHDNKDFVESVIGVDLAQLFLGPQIDYSVEDIIEGHAVEIPKDISSLQQITELLEHSMDKCTSTLESSINVLRYLDRLPMDFGLRVFRKLVRHENTSFDLSRQPEYEKFLDRLEEVHDGS